MDDPKLERTKLEFDSIVGFKKKFEDCPLRGATILSKLMEKATGSVALVLWP